MTEDLFLSDLLLTEKSHPDPSQFIPTRELTQNERDIITSRATNAHKRATSNHSFDSYFQAPEDVYYATILLPDSTPPNTQTFFYNAVKRQQYEWESHPLVESMISIDSENLRKILLLAQGREMPQPPIDKIPIYQQHLKNAIAQQNPHNFLFYAATLAYLHPDNPHFVENMSTDLDSMWHVVQDYIDKEFDKFRHNSNQRNFFLSQYLSPLQVLYPGRVRELKRFDEYAQHAQAEFARVRQTHTWDSFAQATYNLAMVTSGGIKLSANGMELLPYQPNTLSGIPSVPEDY